MTTAIVRWAAIAAAPVGLAALAAIHPIVVDQLVPAEALGAWTLIHTAQLPLAAWLGVAVVLLIERLDDIEARAARLAVVPWAVAFAAYDGIAGLAAGSLSAYADANPETATTVLGVAANLGDSLMVSAVLPLTALAFGLVAFGGAAIALHRAGVGTFAAFAIGAGGITWTFMHPLVGAPAMLLFLFGAVTAERVRRTTPTTSLAAAAGVAA
jgi:hypothetical protein